VPQAEEADVIYDINRKAKTKINAEELRTIDRLDRTLGLKGDLSTACAVIHAAPTVAHRLGTLWCGAARGLNASLIWPDGVERQKLNLSDDPVLPLISMKHVSGLPTHSVLSVGYSSMLAMYCGPQSVKEGLRKNLHDFTAKQAMLPAPTTTHQWRSSVDTEQHLHSVPRTTDADETDPGIGTHGIFGKRDALRVALAVSDTHAREMIDGLPTTPCGRLLLKVYVAHARVMNCLRTLGSDYCTTLTLPGVSAEHPFGHALDGPAFYIEPQWRPGVRPTDMATVQAFANLKDIDMRALEEVEEVSTVTNVERMSTKEYLLHSIFE
jgi:hypothetical protein